MKIHKMSTDTMNMLLESGFVSLIKSKQMLTNIEADTIHVETIYECNKFGGHKLICVGVNVDWPKYFHYHPAREDVFLYSNKETKPLYIAFAFDKINRFMDKVKNKMFGENDLFIVEMIFNHPEFSCFTINPNILHGEFTDRGSDANPMFFVTEPSKMDTNFVKVEEIKDMFTVRKLKSEEKLYETKR